MYLPLETSTSHGNCEHIERITISKRSVHSSFFATNQQLTTHNF
jgi:hypothetical protein